MEIAHVTFGFWPIRGGADSYLAELWKVLDAAGHRQVIYQAQAPRPTSRADPPEGLPAPGARLRVIEWPVDPAWPAGRRFWALSAHVARRRGELARFDRIIAHYPHYALPLLGHRGLIGLSHGVTWDCAPSSPANRAKRAIARTVFRRASRFVANDTLFLREMGLPISPGAPAWRPVRPGRWLVPNAVDLERFRPGADQAPEPILLLARNLYRNRGIRLAIEAFARIAGERPDLSLRIAGDDGDPGYREECRARAANLGLGRRIEFAGPIPWRDMEAEYRRSTLSLVPSLCGEGTSLAALESMACGTPVVSTRAGGLADLPCLHADLTPESLAAAITTALARRDALAREQRAAVAERFDLATWAAAWRAVVSGAE